MRYGFLSFVLLASLVARPLQAQVTTLEDEELRLQGWQFDDARATPGSLAAGAVALTGGLLWQGVGHFMLDEPSSVRRFAAAQGLGLLTLGSGLLVRFLAEPSTASQGAATGLQVAGGGLLTAAWMADVIGAFTGTGDRLPNNSADVPGGRTFIAFSTLGGKVEGPANLMEVRAPLEFRQAALDPQVEVGLTDRYWRASLRVEGRIPFGPTGTSHVSLGGAGFGESLERRTRLQHQVSAEASLHLDLGDVFPHLAGLTWDFRAGVAWLSVGPDADGRNRLRDPGTLMHVPVETRLGFNLSPTLSVALGYRHRQDTLVGMARPRFGSVWGRLGILPWERVGVVVQAEQGAATRLHIGFEWRFADF